MITLRFICLSPWWQRYTGVGLIACPRPLRNGTQPVFDDATCESQVKNPANSATASPKTTNYMNIDWTIRPFGSHKFAKFGISMFQGQKSPNMARFTWNLARRRVPSAVPNFAEICGMCLEGENSQYRPASNCKTCWHQLYRSTWLRRLLITNATNGYNFGKAITDCVRFRRTCILSTQAPTNASKSTYSWQMLNAA